MSQYELLHKCDISEIDKGTGCTGVISYDYFCDNIKDFSLLVDTVMLS